MSSGFVSEKDLAEAKLRRQEEWEKVRTSDQPLEVPEEPYDSRSLFERLEEQRKKRDLEFEESRKLKNMIKGLDDEEIDFLDLVDQKKMEAEKNKNLDEERELSDYRNRVASLQEKSLEDRLHAEIKPVAKPKTNNATRLSQNKLLQGIVVKKSNGKSTNEGTSNKRKHEDKIIQNGLNNETVLTSKRSNVEKTLKTCSSPPLKCIGILPGMGNYADSSTDSDSGSSDIETEIYSKPKFDLLGREIKEKKIED